MPDTHAVTVWKEITDLISNTLTGFEVQRVYSFEELSLKKIKQSATPTALVQLAQYSELERTQDGKAVEVNIQFDIQLAGRLGSDLMGDMDAYLQYLDTLKRAYRYNVITLESGEKLHVKDVQCSNDQLYDERAFLIDQIFLVVCCLTMRGYRIL